MWAFVVLRILKKGLIENWCRFVYNTLIISLVPLKFVFKPILKR